MQPSFVSTPTMRALAACVASGTPIVFEGDPGEGKTAKIIKFTERWGYFTKVLLASLREAPDFLGNPYANPEHGWTEHLAPKFVFEVNAAEKAVVLLDEINTADPSSQKALQRVIEEGYVGEEKLGPNVTFVAIMNPVDIATDGFDLAAAIANRFIHLPWHFDVDEWMLGVLDDFESQVVYPLNKMGRTPNADDHARIRGIVTAFLKAKSSYLKPGAPKTDVERGKPWASPRAWTKFMKAAAYLHPGDDGAMTLLVKGSVGEDAAKEFMTYLREQDLYDPSEVLKDPSIVNWAAERADRLYSLTNSIVAYVLLKDETATWSRAMRALTVCAENGKTDVALPAVRILLSKTPDDAKVSSATQNAFADLFERTGQWQAA